MSATQPYPTEIVLQRSGTLRITWSDGRHSVIPLRELRRACPCASCRQAREELARNPLAVLPTAQQSAAALGAELVGHYALRIHWEDGHDTGLYDFALLRTLGEEAAGEGSSS